MFPTIKAKTSDLIPYARNSRTHSDEQVKQIASSIKEFGFTNPIIIDEDNGVIAGHGRIMAANKLGLDEVPCVQVTGWTEAQKKAYVIADNKLALNAGWDEEMLKLEFEELQELDFDLNLTGFSEDELADLMPVDENEGLTDEDAVPEVENEPVSIEGDIWLLGDHRVMCGDSTDAGTVALLMDGEKADMVFTDPPYNVDYSGRGEKNKLGKIKNDHMPDDKFMDFVNGFYDCYDLSMKPLACIYVCHPDSQSAPKIAFEVGFQEKFKKSSTIIWRKQSAGMGWQDYRAQHEPILYGWKEGKGKHFFCNDRTKTTVWDLSRDSHADYVHPTQKPVALPAEAIENSSKGDDIILDLFLGSGSTLIAAHKTGRKCYGMELDPHYVDVIIKRWEEFTGKKATMAGDTYEDVAAARGVVIN